MPDTEQHEEFMPESMDDLRGRTPDELRKMAEDLDAHLKALHQTDEGELRDLTDDEESAFNLGMQLRTEILDRLDKHTKIADVFRRRPAVVQQAYANIRYRLDDPEARDKALRILDSRDAADLSDAQKTQVEKQLRRDTITARRILVTENEDYR